MSRMKLYFIRSSRGSIHIEFSMVIILFLFTLLSCAEIARLLYISANLDLAVSEAAKSAKNKEKDDNTTYQEAFQEKLISQQGVLGSFISNNNSAIVDVNFSNSITGIINSSSNTSDNDSNAIYNNEILARYTVNYTYKPVFLPFNFIFTDTLLRREVIFVQEK